MRELIQAALMPHIKDSDRRQYIRTLEEKTELVHNLTREEQAAENLRAKEFFKKNF